MSVNTTPIALTRAQIETAIRASDTWGGTPTRPVAGDMREQYDGYLGVYFESTVLDVWRALQDGPLADSHHVLVNFTWEPDHTTSGAQVEVTLPMTNGYVAAGWHELKHLTADRAAVGIDGLVAVADRLIDYANESLHLARPLVEAEREALLQLGEVRR